MSSTHKAWWLLLIGGSLAVPLADLGWPPLSPHSHVKRHDSNQLASGSRSAHRDPGRPVSLYLQETNINRISFDVHSRMGIGGCGVVLAIRHHHVHEHEHVNGISTGVCACVAYLLASFQSGD